MRGIRPRTARARAAAALIAGAVAFALTACGSSSGSTATAVASAGSTGTDDGSTLTLWTRAPLEKQAKPLAVSNLRVQVQGVIDYGATEAGVVVLALPCVVLFLILQRHYVRGFMSGALKG